LASDVKHLAAFANYVFALARRAPRQEEEVKAQDCGPEYPAVADPEKVSEWERILYRAMYQCGIRSIPQYPVEKYLLDFALFAGERRLNVEVDGEKYHRNWDGELCRRDQIRNQRLIELGWDVIRFWVYQVRDDLDACVERVRRWPEVD
jgi:very-short-patch-repair endonuclease